MDRRWMAEILHPRGTPTRIAIGATYVACSGIGCCGPADPATLSKHAGGWPVFARVHHRNGDVPCNVFAVPGLVAGVLPHGEPRRFEASFDRTNAGYRPVVARSRCLVWSSHCPSVCLPGARSAIP